MYRSDATRAQHVKFHPPDKSRATSHASIFQDHGVTFVSFFTCKNLTGGPAFPPGSSIADLGKLTEAVFGGRSVYLVIGSQIWRQTYMIRVDSKCVVRNLVGEELAR